MCIQQLTNTELIRYILMNGGDFSLSVASVQNKIKNYTSGMEKLIRHLLAKNNFILSTCN